MPAWVTPVDPPGSDICVRVYCPSGSEYEAALRGAILSLTEAENWENVNGQDVTTVAGAYFEAYLKTLDWRRCMPVGTVFSFAGWSVPDGSLACDGASYNTADYPELFDAIGHIWGGSGVSFNVPDLQEKFAVGTGPGIALASVGGEKEHTLTVDEMPRHRHEVDGIAIVLDEPVPGIIPDIISEPLLSENTSYTGGDDPHNNMPPYAGLLPCIVAR